MKRKTRLVLQASAAVMLATGLAACGNGNDNGSPPAPAPSQTGAARQEDQFGLVFGTDFRADPNGEPSPVADGDLVAVSLVTEPVTIN